MATETETLSSEMEMPNYDQRCCCCSMHRCFKDIYTEYNDTGECEVYSEMIKSTFNINIAHEKRKNICEDCIIQLRNAHNFKIKLLKNHEGLLRNLIKWQKGDFKYEEFHTKIHQIKPELNDSDDESHEDFIINDQLNGSENQLKINIKKESVVENMIQSINQQIEQIDNQIRPNERKRKIKSGVKKTTKRKKNPRETIISIGTKLREDTIKLITNSSLWVFQWKGHGEYTCYICSQSYTEIDLLKKHTNNHTTNEIERKITNSNNGRVKVEISDLFCKICFTKLETLTDLQKHFQLHNIVINEHLLVPFKLNNEFKCQNCAKMFQNFRLLRSHMLKHYQNYVCEICGAEFYKKEYLSNHIKNLHTNIKTDNSLRNTFKCRHCDINFPTYPRKLQHMVQNHGLKKPEFPCKLCSKVYIIKGLLNRHMKLTHLDELKVKNYECDVCFKRFYRSHDVKRHKETHSESLNFSCGICNHSFKLKTSLDRHIRKIHRK